MESERGETEKEGEPVQDACQPGPSAFDWCSVLKDLGGGLESHLGHYWGKRFSVDLCPLLVKGGTTSFCSPVLQGPAGVHRCLHVSYTGHQRSPAAGARHRV